METANSDTPYELHLFDWNKGSLIWGRYNSIEECRAEWKAIAGRSAKQDLCRFEVWSRVGELVYSGDYVTDEC